MSHSFSSNPTTKITKTN